MGAWAAPRALGRAAGLRAGVALSRVPARARRLLLAAAAGVALLAALYFLWLRDSSLVAVEETTVTGMTTPDAPRIRAALDRAALGMTTLNFDVGELERAAASYPAVAAVEASAEFPHGLTIQVIERPPVAVVPAPGGETIPVAADGTLLPRSEPEGAVTRLPGAQAPGVRSLTDAHAVAALAVLRAAPAALAERVRRITGPENGLAAVLEDGPRIELGDSSRLDAKWMAAATTLDEGAAEGAAYLDVSLPERPAVGE